MKLRFVFLAVSIVLIVYGSSEFYRHWHFLSLLQGSSCLSSNQHSIVFAQIAHCAGCFWMVAGAASLAVAWLSPTRDFHKRGERVAINTRWGK